jgi:hypothetical protein
MSRINAVHRTSSPRPPWRCSAASELVTSIIPPTDRSIPRVRTTRLWPTAASERGMAWSVIEAASNAPGKELIEMTKSTM